MMDEERGRSFCFRVHDGVFCDADIWNDFTKLRKGYAFSRLLAQKSAVFVCVHD